MLIDDNFSELILIAEEDIKFFIFNEEIKMKNPNIIDSFSNKYIQKAISYMGLDINILQKKITSIKFNTAWELLRTFILQGSDNDIVYSIAYLFNYCFGNNFIIKDKEWYIQNIKVTEEWFNRISEIILITNGIKKWDEQAKFDIDKPEWLIEQEKKIRRIKSQNKKTTDDSVNYTNLLKACVQISYEFGYKIEDILQMNYYHFQYIHKYISKIIQYNLHLRAAAAGNTKKKLKYITD